MVLEQLNEFYALRNSKSIRSFSHVLFCILHLCSSKRKNKKFIVQTALSHFEADPFQHTKKKNGITNNELPSCHGINKKMFSKPKKNRKLYLTIFVNELL